VLERFLCLSVFSFIRFTLDFGGKVGGQSFAPIVTASSPQE
jgi:hypothetical protein